MSWRFNKPRRSRAPKPNWKHDVSQIRSYMETQPPGSIDRKYLECLLYLRIGYSIQQIVDMTRSTTDVIHQHIKTYNKNGLKDFEPKPVKKHSPMVSGAAKHTRLSEEEFLDLIKGINDESNQ